MPYVLWKKNGKRVNTPFVFTESEVDNLASDSDNNYELINTTTRRKKKVGHRKQPKRRRSYVGRCKSTTHKRKTSQAARGYRKRKHRTKVLRRMMAAGRKRRRGMLRKPLPRVSKFKAQAAYDRANSAARNASTGFRRTTEMYRAGQITDAHFIAEQAKHEAALAAFDAADADLKAVFANEEAYSDKK